MNERWSRPNEIELEENADALRRMRVVVWVLGPVALAVLCFLLGLVAGR